MKLVNRVQILNEAVSVSLCANAFGKEMNSFVLPINLFTVSYE